MNVQNTQCAAGKAFPHRFVAALGCMLACVLLALSLAVPSSIVFAEQAQAAVYATEQTVDDEETGGGATADGADDEGTGEAAGEESIEEDELPLSSGLGGGEPVSAGGGFAGIVVVGIVAVAVFFLVLIRRQNSSIKNMNRMFK